MNFCNLFFLHLGEYASLPGVIKILNTDFYNTVETHLQYCALWFYVLMELNLKL